MIILGRLVLPFHSHRDDSKCHPKIEKYSTGVSGNIQFLKT